VCLVAQELDHHEFVAGLPGQRKQELEHNKSQEAEKLLGLIRIKIYSELKISITTMGATKRTLKNPICKKCGKQSCGPGSKSDPDENDFNGSVDSDPKR
jgi:hypothetical protein